MNERVPKLRGVAVAGVRDHGSARQIPRDRVVDEIDCDLPLLLELDDVGYLRESAKTGVVGPLLRKVELHANAAAARLARQM